MPCEWVAHSSCRAATTLATISGSLLPHTSMAIPLCWAQGPSLTTNVCSGTKVGCYAGSLTRTYILSTPESQFPRKLIPCQITHLSLCWNPSDIFLEWERWAVPSRFSSELEIPQPIHKETWAERWPLFVNNKQVKAWGSTGESHYGRQCP